MQTKQLYEKIKRTRSAMEMLNMKDEILEHLHSKIKDEKEVEVLQHKTKSEKNKKSEGDK